MKFESKFNIGDTVYYWSIDKVKILFGRIEAISLYQAEDKEPVWRYSMHQIDPKKYQPILIGEQVPTLNNIIRLERQYERLIKRYKVMTLTGWLLALLIVIMNAIL